MMNLIHNASILSNMQKFMFTRENILKGYAYNPTKFNTQPVPMPMPETETSLLPVPVALPVVLPMPAVVPIPMQVQATRPGHKLFTPFIKGDKLFWCFYIILNGYDAYELNKCNAFAIEKQFKIQTVEKFKNIKNKLKEMKLKKTELEDELVNKPKITIKGLYAMCLIYNISITYIYDRKYIELDCGGELDTDTGTDTGTEASMKRGIIVQNEKKEDALRISDKNDAAAEAADAEYLAKIRAEYWLISNIQKPLKAPSAYTTKELQEICEKLEIKTTSIINEKVKPSTKKTLYEAILQRL
jgi:hypothetical protein